MRQHRLPVAANRQSLTAFKLLAAASRELDLFWGTVNTAVLLTSSFTMALAVHAAKVAPPFYAGPSQSAKKDYS